MKTFKMDSKFERTIQQAETKLHELGVSLEFLGDKLIVSVGKEAAVVYSKEAESYSTIFPRRFDDEVLALEEDKQNV